MAEHGVAGTVLVAVDREGTVFRQGFGYSDLESNRPADPARDIFRIASVSKTFTALAVLLEVERGRLSLSEDVNRILRDFEVRNPFPAPVTLHTLLTHTAGIDRRMIGTSARAADLVQPLGLHLAAKLNPVVRPPGASFAYSNYGFALAGHLVEVASGRPFADYVSQEIFAPLGMVDSRFDLHGNDPRLATSYADGKPVAYQPRHTVPAGMMTTTGADMARFLSVLLGDGRLDGKQLLPESAIERMMHTQFKNAEVFDVGYGYGLYTVSRRAGRPDSVYHSGDMRGGSARIEIFTGLGLGVFAASGSAAGAAVHLSAIQSLIDALADAPLPEPADPPVAERMTDHRRYAGAYVYDGVPRTTFDRFPTLIMGGMLVEPGAAGRLRIDGDPYIEVEPRTFRRQGQSRIHVVFEVGEDGDAATLRTSTRTYHREAGLLTIRQQRALYLAALATAAVSVVVWLVQGLRRRAGRSESSDLGRTEAYASLVGLAFLVFMIGFAATAPNVDMSTGVPAVILGLLVLANLGSLLTVPLVAVLFTGVLRSDRSGWHKLHFTLFTAAAVTIVVLLWHWNILGLHL